MRKILFIDRDGTILVEPEDFQVDDMTKLAFLPKVIVNLHRIAQDLDYDLVLVSNQDGLGTRSLPEEAFRPPHNKMVEILAGEGITFADVFIDKTMPEEKAPTRKPGTAMLGKYMSGDYDLENSYVIGDRVTDIQLALNLGTKAILIGTEPDKRAALTTNDWDDIYHFLRKSARNAHVERESKETHIQLWLELDGSGQYDIRTGLSFFDHMLEQFAKHSGCNLRIAVKGDLHVDEHHTVEDTAIVLGEALHQALGNKKGLARFGFVLPMDDALAKVAIDLSGRSWLYWKASFKREKIGDVPTEMFSHFFKSFADAARCNINIQAEGENEHHKIEAIFKAVAKSIQMAIAVDSRSGALPTTKGML